MLIIIRLPKNVLIVQHSDIYIWIMHKVPNFNFTSIRGLCYRIMWTDGQISTLINLESYLIYIYIFWWCTIPHDNYSDHLLLLTSLNPTSFQLFSDVLTCLPTGLSPFPSIFFLLLLYHSHFKVHSLFSQLLFFSEMNRTVQKFPKQLLYVWWHWKHHSGVPPEPWSLPARVHVREGGSKGESD